MTLTPQGQININSAAIAPASAAVTLESRIEHDQWSSTLILMDDRVQCNTLPGGRF